MSKCALFPSLTVPCINYRKNNYCPSNVMREAGPCPLRGLQMCRRCETARPESEFTSSQGRLCRTCAVARLRDYRGGYSHRRVIAVCNIDGSPCPKSNGMRCNRCSKTHSDNPPPPALSDNNNPDAPDAPVVSSE